MAQKAFLTGHAKSRDPFYRVIIPVVLTLLCFVIAALLPLWPPAEIMEWRFYDQHLRAKPVTGAHYTDPAITIIAMDEDSFRAIEEPLLLWVSKYTAMFRAIKEGGAKVIGFDSMQMKTPDQFVYLGISAFINRCDVPEKEKKALYSLITSYNPRFDNEFGGTIRDTGSIIATMIEEKSNTYRGSHVEIEMFAGKENLATVNVNSEKDGVLRTVPTYFTDSRGESFFSFSFLVACRYLGREAELRDGSFLKGIPLLEGGKILIHYTGPWGPGKSPFTVLSFRDVDRKARSGDRNYFSEHFNGKIVLLGATDVSSQDLKQTPFTYQLEYPGVEVQAQAINTIIHGDYLRKASPLLSYLLIALIILASFFVCSRFPLPAGLPMIAGLSFLYWQLTVYLFNSRNLWLPLAVPLMAVMLVLVVAYAYRFMIEESEKQWIRGALCRYVSEPVAREIMSNPDMVKLGGEEREITVLFSDINHFTTISETRQPEEIMEALNEYFTLMEEVIFTHQGTLKQFVGDEIMVMFGAPVTQPDHRVRAVNTALDMQSSLELWRKKREEAGTFHFGVKMGIHSGKVVAGNVGSPHRTEYAAIGDTVNTTARIMGLNKTLGTDILVSEEIYDAVRETVIAEDRGLHQVKGKAQQLHVYALIGRKQ